MYVPDIGCPLPRMKSKKFLPLPCAKRSRSIKGGGLPESAKRRDFL